MNAQKDMMLTRKGIESLSTPVGDRVVADQLIRCLKELVEYADAHDIVWDQVYVVFKTNRRLPRCSQCGKLIEDPDPELIDVCLTPVTEPSKLYNFCSTACRAYKSMSLDG